MRTLLFTISIFISSSAMSQIKYGFGYGLHFFQIDLYRLKSDYNKEIYWCDKWMPEQQLHFYVEPISFKSQNKLQLGVVGSYYTNGYRTDYRDSYGNGDVGGSWGATVHIAEKAQFTNVRMVFSLSYLHAFGKKRNTKFETGLQIQYGYSLLQKFDKEKTTNRYHSTTHSESPTPSTSTSNTYSEFDTIRIPKSQDSYLTIAIPFGVRFGKNQNSALHILPAINLTRYTFNVQNDINGSNIVSKWDKSLALLLRYTYQLGVFKSRKKE